MTASSYYNFWGAPRNARLRQRRVGRKGGSWYVKRNDKRQWLKIDFGGLTRVWRIATQGRQNADQWVTSYYVSYSVKGFRFVTYKEYGRTKVSANFKQLLDEVFVISTIIKVEAGIISRSRRYNPYQDVVIFIILDITKKPESNNCFTIH